VCWGTCDPHGVICRRAALAALNERERVTRRTGLAKELRRIRIERGLRRAELAERAGVDVRTIDSIESNGNVGKVGTLEALAAALNTDDCSRRPRSGTPPSAQARAADVGRAAQPLLEHAVCWGCWVFGFDRPASTPTGRSSASPARARHWASLAAWDVRLSAPGLRKILRQEDSRERATPRGRRPVSRCRRAADRLAARGGAGPLRAGARPRPGRLPPAARPDRARVGDPRPRGPPRRTRRVRPPRHRAGAPVTARDRRRAARALRHPAGARRPARDLGADDRRARRRRDALRDLGHETHPPLPLLELRRLAP
jgi:transcriptional regulator with XRE-family HTH domain